MGSFTPSLAGQPKDSCLNVYSNSYQSNVAIEEKLKLINDIEKRLQADPHGFPLHIVSDTIEKHLVEISEKYELILGKIGQDSDINAIQFATMTTETALKTFANLNRDLAAEMKKAKVDETKVKNLAEKMKTCLGNLSQCSINIREAVEEARTDMNSAKELLSELREKADEFASAIPELKKSNLFSDDVVQLLADTLQDQQNLLGSSYARTIEAHLDNQQALVNLANVQIPSILQARTQAAHLQAAGVKGLNALSLAKQRQHIVEKRSDVKSATLDLNRTKRIKESDDPSFQEKINESKITDLGQEVITLLDKGELEHRDVLTFLYRKLQSQSQGKAKNENSGFSTKDVIEISQRLIESGTKLNFSLEGHSTYYYLPHAEGAFEMHLWNEHGRNAGFYYQYFAIAFLLPKLSPEDFHSYLDWADAARESKILELKEEIKDIKSSKAKFSFLAKDKVEYRQSVEALNAVKLKIKQLEKMRFSIAYSRKFPIESFLGNARSVETPTLYIYKGSRHNDSKPWASLALDVHRPK
jgi:hypothetical protein